MCIRDRIFSLKELQSEMFRHNSITEKYTVKKNELEKEISEMLRMCYKIRLHQVYLHKCAKYLANTKSRKPPMMFLCKNEKEYLGATFIYMAKIIVPLKNSPPFFKFLAECIDAAKDVTEDDANELAEEMVYLFLADFTSFDKSFFRALGSHQRPPPRPLRQIQSREGGACVFASVFCQ
eukprot:TRINITY_DN21020_c0_g1_i1.p1 TRINITY_DN21020_c0_g1~~TRINITY_DN21020_c0_g1_i1.p1  ORF type:complete len:194 (-),score=41.18 TRINITY_DN21020_c0_g1_i1:269-805(-)